MAFDVPSTRIAIFTKDAHRAFAERLAEVLRSLFPHLEIEVQPHRADPPTEVPAPGELRLFLPLLAIGEANAVRGWPEERTFYLSIGPPDKDYSPKAAEPGGAMRSWEIGDLEDLIGRIAGAISLGAPLDLGPHRAKLEALAESANPEVRRARQRSYWAASAAALLVFVGLGAGAWLRWRDSQVTERFGFEQEAPAWQIQNTRAPQAFTALQRTTSVSKSGRHALEIRVEMAAARTPAVGEAWVALSAPSFEDPVNLLGETVVAWVRASAGTGGNATSKIQLFVKDRSWNACYGPELQLSEKWQKLSVAVGESTPSQYIDAAFDGSAVRAIGIKMVGPSAASKALSGTIYLDSIGW